MITHVYVSLFAFMSQLIQFLRFLHIIRDIFIETCWKQMERLYIIKYTSEWYTNVVVFVAFLTKVLNNYRMSWNSEPTI